MSIISAIGRRSFKVRCLIGAIYVVLVLGAITMVYPFLIMVAGSTKSAVDTPQAEVLPGFLTGELALFRKDTEAFYNESLDLMRSISHSDAPSFALCEPPDAVNDAYVDAWERFVDEHPPPFYAYGTAYLETPVSRGTIPSTLRGFKAHLQRRFGGDLAQVNHDLGTDYGTWSQLQVPAQDYRQRRVMPSERAYEQTFREYAASLPRAQRYYFDLTGFWRQSFLRAQYTQDIGLYNREHQTAHASWDAVRLPRRFPRDGTAKEQEDWEVFVRDILNVLWLRADADAAPLYRQYLEARYGTIDAYNRNYGESRAAFDEVPLITVPPFAGIALSDWVSFLQGWQDPVGGKEYILPVEHISIASLGFAYQDWLQSEYQTIERLNQVMGLAVAEWGDLAPPQEAARYRRFRQRTGALRWEYVTRNYRTVGDYILLHGRGLLNTAIYCTLAIAVALIFNPLAAYGLSRFKPPSAYKLLLFLMLTMAFPPMVTQIPVFLMLRELSLLNTFWALVLPGLANGYSIFLLKGFFDSLPQELYESASIDGASELRIFWQITMSLSKPILAVIALNAFTLAYGNFMMALLICQDQKMWTLMPWLYQLQQRSGQGIVFASLVIAAIPTFFVFSLCQNVIMRGIVVPVEK